MESGSLGQAFSPGPWGWGGLGSLRNEMTDSVEICI